MNICMIPVRQGSQRLAKKNYLKINGKAIYEIAIEKAIASNAFDKIVLNTDDSSLKNVKAKFGIDFYLRNSFLASSDATSEMVVLDFFNAFSCERVFWLNTVSPLQTLLDIKNFVSETISNECSSSVAVSTHNVHSYFDGSPLNYNWSENFSKTQDLKPVTCFNYSMMSWHKSFIKNLQKGQLFNETSLMIESSPWSNFLLKSKEDFDLIESLERVAPI
jgi:CMP-N-acetylneuraminic acid synthetase